MFPKPFATCATNSWLGEEDMGPPKLRCSFLSFSLLGVRYEACLVLQLQGFASCFSGPKPVLEKTFLPQRGHQAVGKLRW